MSFKIEDDHVYLKYNEIWNRIRELLNGIKLVILFTMISILRLK